MKIQEYTLKYGTADDILNLEDIAFKGLCLYSKVPVDIREKAQLPEYLTSDFKKDVVKYNSAIGFYLKELSAKDAFRLVFKYNHAVYKEPNVSMWDIGTGHKEQVKFSVYPVEHSFITKLVTLYQSHGDGFVLVALELFLLMGSILCAHDFVSYLLVR